jgi:FixJ family two-component response regulator
VETFATTTEFLTSLRTELRQCLVLDVRLQGLSGLDFQSQLRAANINIPIIFITGHGDIPMTVKAMKAGAVEFLTKPVREQDLLDAVQIALGDVWSQRKKELVAELQARIESLTCREHEVMTLATAGKINKQIAAEIGLCETAVKIHRHNVMKKMGANSLPDLVRMAIAHNESCGHAESCPINGQSGGGTVVRRLRKARQEPPLFAPPSYNAVRSSLKRGRR